MLSEQDQKNYYKPEKLKVDAYLQLICIAINECNGNRGTLRKQLWAYLMREFPEAVDYRDFLLCIHELLQGGRLKNKDGYYFVEQNVFHEIVTTNTVNATLSSKNSLKSDKDQSNVNVTLTRSGRVSVSKIANTPSSKFQKALPKMSLAARSVSIIPPKMGGEKVQKKIDSYFAKSKIRSVVKSVSHKSEQNYPDLPDPMGDLSIRMNIKLDDDEASGKQAGAN